MKAETVSQKTSPTTFDHVSSEEEKRALSFSLEENIPTKLNENKVQTEYELFHWQLLQHTKHLSQQKNKMKARVKLEELVKIMRE